MSLRYALLALLGEGEAHGYQLLKRFTAQLGPFWHPNIGQVYQLLRDLEDGDDGPELVPRQDEDRDQLAVEFEGPGERVLEIALDRACRSIGAQDHVAAGDVRGHLRVGVRLEELAQSRHRYLVPATDVDTAQEDEVSRHHQREDATSRSRTWAARHSVA